MWEWYLKIQQWNRLEMIRMCGRCARQWTAGLDCWRRRRKRRRRCMYCRLIRLGGDCNLFVVVHGRFCRSFWWRWPSGRWSVPVVLFLDGVAVFVVVFILARNTVRWRYSSSIGMPAIENILPLFLVVVVFNAIFMIILWFSLKLETPCCFHECGRRIAQDDPTND